ncbi:MAG: hypothetical protein R3Y08_01125 [Rikenellaceae bacterium]
MSLLLIIFGLASGCLLSVLVGFIGSGRNIGFGWAFFLSLVFTPLIGLIVTLLSDPKPYYSERRWGCLGSTIGIITAFILISLLGLFSLLLLI